MQNVNRYVSQWHLADHLNPDLLRSLHFMQLAAGRDIVIRDDDDALLYFLVEGSVQVAYDHLNGKQSVVGTMVPLAMIGDLDLFYRPNLQLTIVTQEASSFLTLTRTLALQYGQDDARFLRLVIHNLAVKLTASTLILKHNVLPLIGQVAAYLVEKADHQNATVEIRSKAYLAELMGTTLRHVNRILNTLAERQIIVVHPHQVTICDIDALIALAET